MINAEEIAESIDAAIEARKQAAVQRMAERRRARAQLNRRRAKGLRARHARKIRRETGS